MRSRLLLPITLLAVAAILAGVVLAWRPAIPPMDAAAPTPAADLVHRGATFAALGNCAACHSAPGLAPYSGGVPVETPLGTVYGSNLTPDRETGLGRWSEAAFGRAMREGISRDGRHLYPAFPYNHFTLASDDETRALYAFLMTRPAVRHEVPATTLPFPLNIRAVMAGWNLLFFRQGPFRPDPTHDETWNRGAALVEGLGHCGACHTPRNVLGAERSDAHLAGGMAEGWNAYALNAASPAPIPWTVDSLSFYLRNGWQEQHGVSRGPMAAVTANLGSVPEADIRAMAVYLVSLMAGAEKAPAPPAPGQPLPAASAGTQVEVASRDTDAGAALYAGACASCHDSGRPVPYGGLALQLSSAVHAPDPSNIVTVTLHGLPAPPAAPGSIMPGFDGAFDDAQIVAILRYLRAEKAHEPPWPDLEKTVREARTRPTKLFPSDGVGSAPADTEVRIAP